MPGWWNDVQEVRIPRRAGAREQFGRRCAGARVSREAGAESDHTRLEEAP